MQVAAPVVGAVVNATLGVGDMINDVKTVFDPHTSWLQKLGAVADFGLNAFMDVTTVMGVGEGLKAAYMGVKAGLKMGIKFAAKEVTKEGEEIAAKDIEHAGEQELEHEGEDVAKEAVTSGCNSFRADTPVATPSGEVAIGKLKVGDSVIALDVATGKVQSEPIQNVMIHLDNNLLDVTIADVPNAKPAAASTSNGKSQQVAVKAHGAQAPPIETLHTTTEHPFLTTDLGWVNALDLKAGEHVRKLDGSLGVVVGVTVVTGTAIRYNLTVTQDHTFAVGTDQWVVHNSGEVCSVGDDPYQGIREQAKANMGDSLQDPHIKRSFDKRGWSEDEINDILDYGDTHDTADISNGRRNAEPATRFSDPYNGRNVTINNRTGKIIQLGDSGFGHYFSDFLHDVLWGDHTE